MHSDRHPGSMEQEAERFDAALEHLRAGQVGPEEEAEFGDLLHLAARLERELPADLPDPAFRERLKQQLIAPPARPAAPVDLARERRRRRPWRGWPAGVGAAALAAILVVAVIANWGGLTGGGSPGTATSRTAGGAAKQPATAGGSDSVSALSATAQPPADGATTMSQPETSAARAPLDEARVVKPPLGFGGGASGVSGTPGPTVAWKRAGPLPALPGSGTVYRFSVPADGEAFLTEMAGKLGIAGQIRHLDGSFGPLTVIEGRDGSFVQWDPSSGFFTYQRGGPAPRASAGPPPDVEAVARRWLEQAGFDLSSMSYETTVMRHPDGSATVRFSPSGMPQPALHLRLGMDVEVAADGTVRAGMGFWYSLAGSAPAPLRTSDEGWAVVEAGRGLMDPFSQPRAGTTVTVDSARLTAILVRAGDGGFLLEPAIEYLGRPDPGTGPEVTSVFVAAVR